MTESEIFLIYATFGDRETALGVSRSLVEAQLLACANVLPGATSIYRWQGKTCEEAEVVVVGKTSGRRLASLKSKFAELHPYDCPCLVALPISEGLSPFLQWVEDSVGE